MSFTVEISILKTKRETFYLTSNISFLYSIRLRMFSTFNAQLLECVFVLLRWSTFWIRYLSHCQKFKAPFVG
jgi:hypothetical protein